MDQRRAHQQRVNAYVFDRGKKVLGFFLMLLVITFFSFALMHLAGSDAITELYADKGAVSQEIIDAKKAELGLNQPFLIQYFNWLKGIFRGDMGKSYVTGQDVFSTFFGKLPVTICLAISAVVLTLVVSIPLGILSAKGQNSILDYFLRVLSFVGNATPGFLLALILMQIFSIKLGLFPVLSSEMSIKSFVLPTLTLAIPMSAKYTRQIRSGVLEQKNQDYVLGARSRGIPERQIFFGSILKNAMADVLPLFRLSIGNLLGGCAIVESIFTLDGVGKMALDGILMRDYPVVLAYVVWMAVIYSLVQVSLGGKVSDD